MTPLRPPLGAQLFLPPNICCLQPILRRGRERRPVQRTALRRASTGERILAASPLSILLRFRVMLPFAELRQMFLVEAIDLGLHLGMPALDQDGEFTHQPSRAKPVE